jgi:hypothetical protein
MAIDPISNVAGAAAKIISLFKEDPTVKAQLGQQVELAQVQGQIQELLAQIQVNTTEASSQSTFVAGWRPGIGWVCGGAFAYTFVVQPFLQFLVAVFHPTGLHLELLPKLDSATLMTILGAILGLGTMRSYDKSQGTGSGH